MVLSLIGLFVFDTLIELQILPIYHRGIPVPLEASPKPVGSSLFSFTFFHLFLIILNIMAISYILNKFDFKNNVFPIAFDEKINLIIFLIFSLSGSVMWFYPIFLIVFISTGVYLLISELK